MRSSNDMLGYATLFKMRLFPAVILGILMMVTAVELQCDPATQYEENNQCCQMCGPGTRMSSRSTCKDPQCDECGEGEYQDHYTNKYQCDAQPYCDPNKNFEAAVHQSKKTKNTCMCKPGFHCSSETCLTCVPHTTCGPGSEAQIKGNHSTNTVCRKCPEGTFSNITSWDSVCRAWTKCAHGYSIEREGTAESDSVCAQSSRMHVVLWITFAALGVIALVGVVYWQCRGTVKDKIKHVFCDDSHHAEEQNMKTVICINIPPEIETFLPIQHPQEENSQGMTPEENLDEESQDAGNITDNGNFVMQERGKSEILSRQESQTCTFIDSS